MNIVLFCSLKKPFNRWGRIKSKYENNELFNKTTIKEN